MAVDLTLGEFILLYDSCFTKTNFLYIPLKPVCNISNIHSIEFSLCTKLATLAIKACVGKIKINSAKKLPPLGIEPGTSCDPLRCLLD